MTVTLDREDTIPPPPTPPTPAEADTGTHTMHVCDQGNHSVVTWTYGDPNTEAEAAKVFQSRKQWGYLAYATRAPGENVTLHAFDASAPTIVLSRPLQGG
jgi:hypothetical protein